MKTTLFGIKNHISMDDSCEPKDLEQLELFLSNLFMGCDQCDEILLVFNGWKNSNLERQYILKRIS